MALTAVSEGGTSNPNDLNQVVNLLNGTTTNTQVTLRGGFSSSLAGQSARFIGGSTAVVYPTFDSGTPAEPSDSSYHLQQGDLSVLPGGPFIIGSGGTGTFLTGVSPGVPPTRWYPSGNGGYAARMHLAGTVNVTGANQYITMDTVDFDPRGMVKPFAGPGGGLAITVPQDGAFAFTGAIRGKGVNSASCGFYLTWYDPATSSIGSSSLINQTTIRSASSAFDYTGGMAFAVIFVSVGMQLCFTSVASPRSTFQVDNTDSSRTYISAWIPN